MKRRSVPPYGPYGSGRTLLFTKKNLKIGQYLAEIVCCVVIMTPSHSKRVVFYCVAAADDDVSSASVNLAVDKHQSVAAVAVNSITTTIRQGWPG